MVLGGLLGGAVGGATVQIVIKAVDQYSKEFNKLDDSVKTQQTGFNKLTGFIKNTGIGYAALAGAAVDFGIESVKSYLEVERAAQSFNLVAGETADILLNDLKKASKGMVSNFDLMQSANKALMLGIEQNQLPKLMEMSTALGKVMGRTVTEAFGDITLGIGRQSKLILDNLGIIVNAEDAYNRYAITLGKTANQLTETEKKQAFANEVIAQGTALTEAMKYATETHTEKLQRLSASWENVKSTMGEALVGAFDWIESMGKVVIAYDLWAEDVKSPEVQEQLQNISDEIRGIYEETNKLREENEAYIKDLEDLTKTKFPQEIELEQKRIRLKEELLDANESEVDGIKTRIEEIDKELERFDLFRDKQELNVEYWQLMKDKSNITMQSVGTDIQATMDMYDKNLNSISKNTEAINTLQEQSKIWADQSISDIDRVLLWLKKLFIAGDSLSKNSLIGGITGIGQITTTNNKNAQTTNQQQSNTILPTIKLNDFIIQPNAQDTIIGTKTPKDLGMTINIYGDNYGTDPEEIAKAIASKIGNSIKI